MVLTFLAGSLSASLIFLSLKNFPVFEDSLSVHGVHFSFPENKDFFESAYGFDKKIINISDKNVVAAIVPHHLLASDLIAELFYNIREQEYDTVVVLGPNHYNNGGYKMISSRYNWYTPYGILDCDGEALDTFSSLENFGVEEKVISAEHSVASEVAFIERTFPNAKILPIILKPGMTPEDAEKIAKRIVDLSENKKVLVLASVDFSHYKDSATAEANDKISIAALENADFEKIYNLDLDSPTSVYTILKVAELKGAKFELINNSNSAILSKKPNLKSTTSYVTGVFTSSK